MPKKKKVCGIWLFYAAVRRDVDAHCPIRVAGRGRKRQLPFVTVTYAQSIDGSIALNRGKFKFSEKRGVSGIASVPFFPCPAETLLYFCLGLGEPLVLSGSESMGMTHMLRANHDGTDDDYNAIQWLLTAAAAPMVTSQEYWLASAL